MARQTHATSYCRLCSALCGIEVEIEDGRVTTVRGDRAHPLTQGFTCPKGRRLGDFHSDPERLLESQRRGADGHFQPVPALQAISEIASSLNAILARHGPGSVGLFSGTQALTAALTSSFARGWFRAIGSPKLFSTMTIDQSAKWVAWDRLGTWAAGRPRFEDADVWLIAGSNPLISLQGGEITGFPIHNPWERIREARRRGMKLIVVDPRATELARESDLHLQLVPGTDAALFAGILHVILDEGLHDASFCARYADGLEALRAGVAPVTPARCAEITGLGAGQIVEAARIFGGARRGSARSGTGPDMGPAANAAEHLIQALNVICGRFPRAGDRLASASALGTPRPRRAEVVPPARSWETGYQSRLGHGLLMGELPSPSLPEEILAPGEDRIRALVVVGGNPANAFPGQDHVIEALRDLELLVTIDPYLTETARLSHYVIAPTLAFERPEDTRGYEHFFSEAFAQYTPALLERPAGVLEDWEFFYHLASEMGITLTIGRSVYAPGGPKPSSDELLERYASKGRIPHEEIKRHSHGHVFDELEPELVQPESEGASGRFDLYPSDVAGEVAEALAAAETRGSLGRPYRLIVGRTRETLNSLGRRLPGLSRRPYNPCFVHPDDLAAIGASPGQMVRIVSDHGDLEAVVEPDTKLRRGVLSMTHGYGDLPEDGADPRRFGSNPSRLLSISKDLQSISLMPLMTAVPVAVEVDSDA